MYSVTSSFQSQAAQRNAAFTRKLLFGTSDYSDRVLSWPTIDRAWNDINPSTLTINLANADGLFNFFLTTPVKLRSSADIKIGIGGEYVTMFSGKVDAAQYRDGTIDLTLIDKFNELALRVVGDTTSPVSYTASAYMVHDMAWYACTSLGGLSALSSTNNPDIDYASFGSWSSLFSADNTRVSAQFTGQKPVEILQKLANLTQSAIFVENNKIKFSRYSITSSATATLTDDNVLDTLCSLDTRNLVNQYFVSAGYAPSSNYFQYTVNAIDSNSVGSYGLFQDNIAEESVWLTNSVSALNLAQRILLSKKEVKGSFQITCPLDNVATTIGDTLLYTDAQLNISAQIYRVMGEALDLENGTKTFTVDQTQLQGAFRLDISALDSSDVLT